MHDGAVGAGLLLGPVEGRPVGPNADVLHDGGHPFASGEFMLQAAHVAHQDLAFGRRGGAREMAAHPLLDVDAHANVQGLACGVHEPIDPGFVGEHVKFLGGYVLGHPLFAGPALQRVGHGELAAFRGHDLVKEHGRRLGVPERSVSVCVGDVHGVAKRPKSVTG